VRQRREEESVKRKLKESLKHFLKKRVKGTPSTLGVGRKGVGNARMWNGGAGC
jgi:hypothetical protein